MFNVNSKLLFFAPLLFIVLLLSPAYFAQSQENPGKIKKKKAKLPPEDLPEIVLAAAQYSFSLSGLKGTVLASPTCLQFGPDDRLYVSEQGGLIKAYTIKRNGANDYSVTATETINLVNQIPNHNDDGSLAPGTTTRQVTSILVRGTRTQPLVYVSSSDSRIGGPGGDLNLDTNSGIISLLTKVGSSWQKMDLVRGLPRSEENHSLNGMQFDELTGILYITVGGLTNAGSPSTNFAYTSEYALSAAILSVDLNVINAMSTKGSGNTAYKYNVPTLDDPTRTNNPDGTDVNDPFGGNDGLNQAKIVTGGPVQIYGTGLRNAYDLIITKTPGKARRMYTIDNGPNQGWGGYPQNEGASNVSNNYVTGEPGSTATGVNDPVVNNLDNLHYIGNLSTYIPGSFYGGHPNPIRANPSGAGLYTHNGTTGVWRTTIGGTNPLPADWPPLPVTRANSIESDFQVPGVKDLALLTFQSSTNGIAEYTASNFSSALKGSLLAAGLNGTIFKISFNEDGTDVTNPRAATNKLNQDLPFASGFGSEPLDIIAQGDSDRYPGTVWAVTYGSQAITIFEPQDFIICTGKYDNLDDDADGYTNADEIDNATQPCSAASMPPDADKDKISDLNDPDDDNDGLGDNVDYFPLDGSNGLSTTLPIKYNLFNNDPGTGLFGVGFTGLMSNKKTDNDYIEQYEEDSLIAGGAVGAFSVIGVTTGDALGALNNQENAFQFGFKPEAGTGPFTLKSRMLGPFFNGAIPKNFQSQGIYLGTGDQSNYLKIALNANGGAGGIEVVYENAGTPVSTQYSIAGGIPGSTLDLILSVNPLTGKVQPKYSSNGGAEVILGSPIQLSGALLTALQGSPALAVGIISTSRGSSSFTANWDYIYVTPDPVTVPGVWQVISPSSGTPLTRIESSYVEAGNKFYLLGGRNFEATQAYDPAAKSWAAKAKPPIELHDFQAVTVDGLIYAAGALTGTYPREKPATQLYIYNPLTDKWFNGATIPASRQRGAAGIVGYNNKIYMIGGILDGHWTGSVSWFDEFDPATNTWTTLPDAPRARDHFHAVMMNDKIYLAGGRQTSGITGQEFNLTIPQVDVYNFTTGAWTTLPATANIPTPRAGAAASLLGSEIIVIGGENAQPTARIEAEALNVETNVWRKLADLQQGRHGMQVIKSNNGLYVVAGAGNQGSGSLLSSQEAFYMFNTTSPNGTTFSQSALSSTATQAFGAIVINSDSDKTVKISNTGTRQAVLVSSITITGTSSFTVAAPFSFPFIIAPGKSVDITVKFKPVISGTQTASMVINHTGQNGTPTVSLNGVGLMPIYRINSGGGQITTSIGTFSADAYYSPSPGDIYTTASAIEGTLDDALYQSERSGSTGTFNYAFPVANGQYRVLLHFAEIYYSSVSNRIFDVSIEGASVLDNYDIVNKAGELTAIIEGFTVNVTDGMLNINFNSLPANGGKDRAKISAIEILSSASNQAPVANAGPDKAITLPVNSTTLNGSGTDAGGGAITSYKWTQVSGPNTAILSSSTVAAPTVSGLAAGTYVFSLVVTDNQLFPSAPDEITLTVNPGSATGTPIYRIHSGGGQITTSKGVFSADAYFSPSPGDTYTSSSPIAATTDDPLYQSERSGSTGSFSYAFPVGNGQYTVILHFAEIYYGATGNRIFDVSAEGIKVLDNYDIVGKAGSFTATAETFAVNVTDGTLNIIFSSFAADGGRDRAKVSAIEILSNSSNQAPIANAGPDKTITLPANSTSLSGSGTDVGGSISGYKWTQESGPNTATFNSTTVASPSVSDLIGGSYTFSLVVTDNLLFPSAPDQVVVTVSASTGTPIYRIHSGGGQINTSKGVFFADDYYTPSPGDFFTTTSPVAGTTDDALYQSERSGSTGTFSYAFPVSNGQYTVILHFAEIYYEAVNNRVFDVSIEGTKVLDNYDIVQKAGSFNATTESFGVNVMDGVLNINFSSLPADGGKDRAKISAIEILGNSSSPALALSAAIQKALSASVPGQKLTATVQPNPSSRHFNIYVTGSNKPVDIKIYNAIGQLIEGKNNMAPGNTLRLGNNYRPGLYYAVIRQGGDKKILKFIKQSYE